MTPALIMHVNYCEQGQSLDDICRKASDWGFDGVEFRRKRIGIEESPEAYLDALAKAVARSGLRQVSFGWPTLEVMTPDAAKREAEVESAARFYESAAQRFRLAVCDAFTGRLVNPDSSVPATDYQRHGSGCATKEHWHWAVSGFQALAARTQPRGVRFAFETHMHYLHDLPATAKRLVEAIGAPNVGINLDYANTLLFPNPPSPRAAIEACGDRLFLVHLKNLIVLTGADHLRVGLADGQINHREFLRLLQDCGYAGPLCLGAPRPGDREWFAQQDLPYLKSLLKEME